MVLTLGCAAAIAVLVACCFVALLRNLAAPGRDAVSDPDWWREFSTSKYRPMARLLAHEDYDFLAAQPGFRRGMARRLRIQRRRVFLQYLRNLRRDFLRLHNTAKLILLQSEQDRADLAIILFKQNLVFCFALMAVRYRLLLQPLGVGRVDVQGLVRAIESMRQICLYPEVSWAMAARGSGLNG
jgi:hypothetical protein